MFSITKFLKSFVYAFRGIAKSFWAEQNMKVHFSATVIVILAGFYFNISTLEWALVVLSIGAVAGAEMMNTAIERMVDHISTEKSENAGSIKDVSAGAVLLVSIAAAVVGILIFGPKILSVLQ